MNESPHAPAKTYRDIPGISQDEIEAIEAFKSYGREFTYGVLNSTEAFQSIDGGRDGFAVLFCELLSGLFDMPFNIEEYGWSDLISNLEDMTVDFTGETTPTAIRQGSKNEWFEVDGEMVPGKEYMMSTPIAERMLRVFTRADSDIRREADLNGLTIGFLEGTTTEREIAQSYRISFTAIEVIVPEDAGDDIDDYDIAVQMLEDGEIDAFVEEATADSAFMKYNENRETIRSSVFFPIIHSPVSLTTANPDLTPIISVINKYIDAGGGQVLYDLYTEGEFRYAKHKLYHSFTPEEKEYIDDLARRGAAVLVGYERDNYPINFYNENEGMFEGIAVDVLTEINKLTGIQFISGVSKDALWSDTIDKLISGEVDMLAQLVFSNERAGHFIWSDIPYASTHYAFLSKANYPFLAVHQISRIRIGVVDPSAKIHIYRELFPNHDNLIGYRTHYECLEALERGEIDLFMTSEYSMLTQTNYLEKPGLMINIMLDEQMESKFGFMDSNAILCSIISKAQNYVDTDMIVTTWTGMQFDYSKKLAEQQRFFMTVIIALMSLAMVAMIFVLTNNVRLSRKLKDMAHNDALTEIFNRRYFMELAELQTQRSNKAGNECYIMIFDLDHFKKVNDTYGHLAGDKVLKNTAQRVKNTIRPQDIFGRYGGEEFVVCITDITEAGKEHAINTAERIRLEICGSPVEFEGIEIPVSASFGVARISPSDGISTAIGLADEALYQAKESGRNKVVFYEL
jgi:diguanylate cyclase (GGDEF)-like protein